MDFYFSSWAEFWAMGKHGFYVWLAYGAGLLVLAYNIWEVTSHKKRITEQARRSFKREQQRVQAMQQQEHEQQQAQVK